MVALASTPLRRRAAPSGPSTGAAAAVQKTSVYGNYIDEVIQIRDHRPTAGPTDQYAHQDDLFSVVALTDANGDVTERFRYGDYGNREALTAAGSPSGSTELRHGFTGRLHDDLVGLIEYRHRWMQPGTGTFVQRDPIGYRAGMNLAAYVMTNPFFFADCFGLTPFDPNDPRSEPGLIGPQPMPWWDLRPGHENGWKPFGLRPSDIRITLPPWHPGRDKHFGPGYYNPIAVNDDESIELAISELILFLRCSKPHTLRLDAHGGKPGIIHVPGYEIDITIRDLKDINERDRNGGRRRRRLELLHQLMRAIQQNCSRVVVEQCGAGDEIEKVIEQLYPGTDWDCPNSACMISANGERLFVPKWYK